MPKHHERIKVDVDLSKIEHFKDVLDIIDSRLAALEELYAENRAKDVHRLNTHRARLDEGHRILGDHDRRISIIARNQSDNIERTSEALTDAAKLRAKLRIRTQAFAVLYVLLFLLVALGLWI